MGFSWAPATLVKASEGLKLCGTHRTRPRHRAIESWMIATSSADRSQSPEDCSVAAASKRDLASMIATLSGSVKPGSSEAMTVGAPRRPRWSSDSACWRGSNRDSLKLFHIAIWRSSAPKAVDNDMLSQSMVLPAFLLSLLDFHASSEMGASDPWLRRESVIPWSHPCCGFDRPVGSKDESAITKCLTFSSAMLWIRKVTRCDLILWTALFASKTSWTVGCGKLPAKMDAAAAASSTFTCHPIQTCYGATKLCFFLGIEDGLLGILHQCLSRQSHWSQPVFNIVIHAVGKGIVFQLLDPPASVGSSRSFCSKFNGLPKTKSFLESFHLSLMNFTTTLQNVIDLNQEKCLLLEHRHFGLRCRGWGHSGHMDWFCNPNPKELPKMTSSTMLVLRPNHKPRSRASPIALECNLEKPSHSAWCNKVCAFLLLEVIGETLSLRLWRAPPIDESMRAGRKDICWSRAESGRSFLCCEPTRHAILRRTTSTWQIRHCCRLLAQSWETHRTVEEWKICHHLVSTGPHTGSAAHSLETPF